MYEYVYFWVGVFCFIVTGDGCLEWKSRLIGNDARGGWLAEGWLAEAVK